MRDPVQSQIYQVSVADAVVTPLTSGAGPHSAPRISPDGRKIAYLGFEDRRLGYQNVRLQVMDRDGHNAHSVSDSLDQSISDAYWAADGRSLYVQYTDRALTNSGNTV